MYKTKKVLLLAGFKPSPYTAVAMLYQLSSYSVYRVASNRMQLVYSTSFPTCCSGQRNSCRSFATKPGGEHFISRANRVNTCTDCWVSVISWHMKKYLMKRWHWEKRKKLSWSGIEPWQGHCLGEADLAMLYEWCMYSSTIVLRLGGLGAWP